MADVFVEQRIHVAAVAAGKKELQQVAKQVREAKSPPKAPRMEAGGDARAIARARAMVRNAPYYDHARQFAERRQVARLPFQGIERRGEKCLAQGTVVV